MVARDRRRAAVVASVVPLAALLHPGHAFYLPGVAPQEYGPGTKVDLKVNKLTSTKTQLPYEYYRLPYCKPEAIENVAENLGEVLRGDRIVNSMYDLRMGVDESCKVLCRKELSDKEREQFAEFVSQEYRVHWILDNLPAATKFVDDSVPGEPVTVYDVGFPMGFRGSADIPNTKDGVSYLNNHVAITIKYHKDASFEGSRIVGFEVEPSSVKHTYQGSWSDQSPPKLTSCSGGAGPHALSGGAEAIFTYDVKWEQSDIKWASRWDTYLLMGDEQIHWFSIINSLMIVLFLSGMVAMIMMRTLHKDLQRYNQLEVAEEAEEETGWKLVHGDVFRPPQKVMLLCVSTGTGVQILGMLLVTMVFAVLGFLSPANRGGLMTALVLLFVFMGVPAGYFSATLFKTLKGGPAWKQNTVLTATLYPGVVFVIFFVLNFFIWGEASSGAVPFGTLVALLLLWFGISTPLVFIGSYFGYQRKPADFPVRTNQIPRQVPEQVWYMQPAFSIIVGGVLPFGAVFIELFFILSSIWLHQFYYVFGFLFLVLIILVITCAEITIVMCYFQLCAEDYHWWWRAFLTSGSSAAYLFLYSIFYFVTKLEIEKFVSGLLFFGYMAIASLIFFVMTGTIGFYACYWFVRKIFSEVKVD
eukprot:CAMPEP_0185185618 /NCGR_PEP_ID=MMETSP1140-20130426/3440_1 /TAXON_ID=298111 /ORGANISM="Pavlova sp., Strain CCMP459" /LENGTH=640 /DNA_ID=CAMNT_0027751819 /DNA_START=19 /DNA_END=1941 /DNA_ORIENTATION=-